MSKKIRKRAYVKVYLAGDRSYRNVVHLKQKPAEADFTTESTVVYFIGPFRTNAGAELVRSRPGVYETVKAAEEAAKRFDL